MITIELVMAPVICAWCGKKIGEYVPTEIGAGISHGICAECAKKVGK
jgi:hypothetical protein